MPTPTWKGFLKLSLVNIPVKVFSATESSATLSFNQLHNECETRIQQKRWCPTCEKEVPYSDIVKGYEFEKGRYVVVTAEDFDTVHVESTKVIDLEKFTDASALDPVFVDRTYYLAPDGKMAAQAFAVVRDGMKGKAGVGKVALNGREYLVKVEPKEQGLVMYTLRHAEEVRSMDSITELRDLPTSTSAAEVKLAQQVIATFEGEVNIGDYRDAYQEGLRAMINAKVDGNEVVAAPDAPAPARVVNLMEALRQSLDKVSANKKPSAKAQAPAKKAARKKSA